MGKNSGIAWTDHTFNPWHGCEKVSEGCRHCYAKTQADRFDKGLWGNWVTSSRKTFGNKYWSQPLKWNKEAMGGKRKTVFCGSMCDIFEQTFDDNIYLQRQKLFDLIRATRSLTWLLLTKRPENIWNIIPFSFQFTPMQPRNVWIGTTIENEDAAQRIESIRDLPFKTFISFEPLIGVLSEKQCDKLAELSDWGIVGGESGVGARRMSPAAATTIIKSFRKVGKPVFFKQAGNVLAKEWGCSDKKGQIISEWPEEFRVQVFPQWV